MSALRLFATRAAPLLPRQGARAIGTYKVPEIQKAMQEDTTRNFADNPTYLKKKGSDSAFAMIGLAGATLGTLYALNGHFNMAHGTGKID